MSLSLGRLDEISEITPYMFLSGYGCLTEPKLAQLGVTCVVDATNIPRSRGWGNSIVHVKVPVDDSEFAKLDVYFDDICNTIHTHREKGGKTLVHCAAGISRSATLCIAYLMKHDKQCLEDAYLYVRKRRRCICPNNGFWRQLIVYEHTLYGVNSVHMLKGRLQRDIPDIYLTEHTRQRQQDNMQLEQTKVNG